MIRNEEGVGGRAGVTTYEVKFVDQGHRTKFKVIHTRKILLI